MTKPVIYISGPMTGLPEFNFPAFHQAADLWRSAGWEVRNPAEEFGGAVDRPYADYIQQDLDRLRECQAIALLPGWDGPNARGSVWERYVGEKIYGHTIHMADRVVHAPVVKPQSCLQIAEGIVHGARQADYGHPLDDFSKTAKMWEAILGVQVSAEKVALCMIAVKISRLLNTPHHKDSVVDIAGYVATYEMVRNERQRREGK